MIGDEILEAVELLVMTVDWLKQLWSLTVFLTAVRLGKVDLRGAKSLLWQRQSLFLVCESRT